MAIDDDAMRAILAARRPYTVLVLRPGPGDDHPERDAIVWEHGRRLLELRDAGDVALILPLRRPDGTDLRGIAVFTTDLERTRTLVDDDPAVRAGVFTADLYESQSFPGDALAP